MKYDVYLTPRAKRQYEKFDGHIRHKIKTELLELEEEPDKKGNVLQELRARLRYKRIFHAGVEYQAVYDIAKDKKEVLVMFIGSRENFLKNSKASYTNSHRPVTTAIPAVSSSIFMHTAYSLLPHRLPLPCLLPHHKSRHPHQCGQVDQAE